MSDVFGNGAVWMGLQLLVKASMLVGAALVVQWLMRVMPFLEKAADGYLDLLQI